MSIKFKQNGQWVKIPTPSQIDDSAASAATTYSSNKINEIIPQDIAKYLLEHKDELGTDDFTKLKNTPYTLIGKTNTKFASIDTMYSYNSESSSPKRNVDEGLYLLKEDIDFSAKYTMNFYEYAPLAMSGSEEFSFSNWTFTIPKGSTMSVQDTFVTIVCPNSIDYEIKTANGSAGDSAKTFMFGALNGDNNVNCICLAKDGLGSPYTYYDAILYGIFSNVGEFSEGQPIVTANSYQGSGSMPSFKLGEAGATTTSITDDNYTNYTTTEKLAKLNAGLYYVNTDKLSINLKGVDIKSQISTLFPQTNVDDTIDVEKGSQITVTNKQTGSPETGYQIQKLVNIYNTEGLGYPYSIFFTDSENNTSNALVSMGADLINTAVSYSYSATNQLGEIMNTCITDESLRGKVPVISAPDEQTATGVKNVFKAMDFPSGVPITTINTANKSEFTTLKGILDHPDGMYLVDDCGVTNGDEQLTIASFKGHCSTMLLASMAQFQEITDSEEIKCYKGSIIYILTDGNISNGATRYVSICNVPMGVSGGSVAPDRASSDAGTSVVNIEVQAVEDRSSGTVKYSYDIDGGTNTLFNQPQYKTMITSYTNMLVSGGIITGKSNYSPNQLVKVVEDADCQLGYRFTGVDASEFKSPIIEVNDSNWSSFNTLQKWMNANAGTYLVKTTKLTVTAAGIDQTKESDNSFNQTLSIPANTYVFVYSTDDSNSSATNFKNVVFQKADNMPSGYYGEWMTFKWDSRKTYSADNVELYPLMTAAMNGAAAVEMVMEVLNLFADLSATDAGKVVKVASGDTSDSYKFQAVDILLIGDTTTITPAQVLAAVNEGKTTTISHTDATYGTLKFTSFGVVTTASGDTVSSSITYGTSADSLMLFTLMGDVTKGTWTMYSRNLTVSA